MRGWMDFSTAWGFPKVQLILTCTLRLFIIMSWYLFLTGDEQLIDQCKRELTSEFEMKDLGLMHYFLGLEVWQKPGEIFLTQGKYTVDILHRLGMQDCKSMGIPMTTNLTKLRDSASSSQNVDSTLYRQLIGSLMYLVHTRPDICYTVNALGQSC